MRRLLVNFARVGDMVLIIPLLRLLAQDATLDLVGRPWARSVLAHQEWLGDIHVLARPYRGHGRWDGLLWGGPPRRLAELLRSRAYDEIITFRQESPKVRAWIHAFAGPARLVELDSGLRTGAVSSHPIDMYRAAAAAAGYDVAGFEPRPALTVPSAEVARLRPRVAALGRRVLSVQAGSSLTHRWYRRRPNLKGLTPAQWAGLLTRILERGEADALILHGSRRERREARGIIAAMPPALRPRCHDWTGQAPLEDLPGIFCCVRALVSVDTGPAHIAAAVGCPTMVVYGPSDPARWSPRGRGVIVPLVGSASCQFCAETPRFRTCRANICLSTVTIDQLDGAWQRLRSLIPPGLT